MLPDLLRDHASICLKAKADFVAKGLPHAKDEAWIYTRLNNVTINPSSGSDDKAASAPALLSFAGGWLVSDDIDLPAGVTLSEMKDDDSLASFWSYLPDDHMVTNLSVGHATGAYLIDIDDKVEMTEPLQLVFSSGQEDSSSHPLIFVRVGRGAKCQIAEIHNSTSGLSAPVLVMKAGEGAQIDHIKLQADAPETMHLALTICDVAANCDLNSFTAAIGAGLGRHETHAHLSGESCELALSSLYLGRGTQHQDITTKMHHNVPNCTSNQIIRGVLDDTAKGVFQGKVVVARDAQKTDGQQMSRALLLSRKAEADAKPELEIFADDVVCSHGATVGELDETHLFYLQSRGIDKEEARNMLIEAFLLDAIEQVRDEALAEILTGAVQNWMAEGV